MLNEKPFYDEVRFHTPSRFLKWISRYEMESSELQNIIQQNPKKFQTLTLDLSVATPASAGLLVSASGRAISLYGITTASIYDPVANTGIEVSAPSAFLWVSFDDANVSDGIALKHNRGFRGDFLKVKLQWPAQPGVSARVVVYKFDSQPWVGGESAT